MIKTIIFFDHKMTSIKIRPIRISANPFLKGMDDKIIGGLAKTVKTKKLTANRSEGTSCLQIAFQRDKGKYSKRRGSR